MKYLQKTFTVPATGTARPVATCEHGMIDPRGRCCFCGEPVPPPTPRGDNE